MLMRKRETFWRVQTPEIGKVAAIDEFTNRRLSLVNTVQRKLIDEPEGNFCSNLAYSDDRPVSPMYLT